jgi:hypothetical protein
MPFKDTADHKQLAVLSAALDEICHIAGIDRQSPARDDTARLLMHLYKNGHRSADKLRAALSPTTLQARFG